MSEPVVNARSAGSESVYFTAYVSSACELFDAQDLLRLLEVSRRNNSRRGITGVLLYHDGDFIQVLEGPEPEVIATHKRISEDPRHQRMMTLVSGQSTVRVFGDWSMGFVSLAPQDQAEMQGFNDFLSHREDVAADSAESKRFWTLLKSFRSHLR